jgi:hypothetical protein
MSQENVGLVRQGYEYRDREEAFEAAGFGE